MLTEDQIDYLLQIKESKQSISERTARVMLHALRWTSEEIERGIAFLKQPDPKPEPALAPEAIVSAEPELPQPSLKPITVKQNPFPVGSPFEKILKERQEKRHNRLTVAGAIIGAAVFILGLVFYALFTGVVSFNAP